MASESFSSPFLQHARQEAAGERSGSASGAEHAGTARAAQAEVYPFSRVCVLLEHLERAVNKQQQTAYLTQFWQGLRRDESFFPYMRLLLPHLDNERAHYQLRESKLARLYVDILGMSPQSTDAQRLLRWKDPSKSAVETTAFSDAIFAMLKRKGGYQEHHDDTRFTADPSVSGSTGSAKEEAGTATTADGRDLKTTLAIHGGAGAGAARPSGMTVSAINRALDDLASAADEAARRAVMLHLVRHTSAVEQKWLVRIILRDMRIRMTHQSMLVVFHPSALDVLNRTNDLRLVCDSCVEDTTRTVPGSVDAGIFLFQPLRPMLASPISAKKLQQLLEGHLDVVAQPKYDGERIMIHMDGQKVMYWTRNAKNYTPLYAPKFDAVVRSCLPIGARRRTPGGASSEPALDVTLQNVILDGEFLVYDATSQSFEAFGGNRTLALLGGDVGGGARNVFRNGTALPPPETVDGTTKWFCYMVFDLVMLNGAALLHLPFTDRQRLLRLILKAEPKHVELVPSTTVHTTAEILGQLETAVKEGNEGIVLKRASSPYVPGERKNDWIKMKTDHMAGLADSLDLVVVGGYYGTKFGARSISHFLLATWVNGSSASPRDANARFHTFCKVGNGYTSDELQLMQTTLEPFWEPVTNRQAVPAWLDGWKPVGSDLIPDVYVHPRHSLVLEVFGYAFTDTANYRAGYTIRFPRMLSIRWDKNLEDATDLQTLNGIREASVGTLQRRLAEGNDELLTVMSLKWKRRREHATGGAEGGPQSETGPAGRRAVVVLPPRTLAVATERLEVTRLDAKDAVLDRLFDGYEFCVLFTSPLQCDPRFADATGSRAALERVLLQHGAKVVANPGRRTSLLLASSGTAPKVANWVNLCRTKPALVAARYAAVDVAHCDWVAACVEAGHVLPLTPRFMIFAGPSLRKKFATLLDAYEDSYTEPCTAESLRVSMHLAQRASSSEDSALPTDLASASARVAQRREELGLADDATGRCITAVQLASPPARAPTQQACTNDPALLENWAVAWLRASAPRGATDPRPEAEHTKAEAGHDQVKREGSFPGGEESSHNMPVHRGHYDATSSAVQLARRARPLRLPHVVLAETDMWSVPQLLVITALIREARAALSPTPRRGGWLVDTEGTVWEQD